MSYRILIIDTTIAARGTLVEELTNDGYDVTAAADYAHAMRILDASLASGTVFDLICLDAHIGGKTGPMVLKDIRRHAAYRQTTILGGYAEVNVWQGTRGPLLIPLQKHVRKGKPDHYWNAQEVEDNVPLPSRPQPRS